MIRFKVQFQNPKRTFYIRASDPHRAFEIATLIEEVYERPEKGRVRTLDQAVIDALQSEEES